MTVNDDKLDVLANASEIVTKALGQVEGILADLHSVHGADHIIEHAADAVRSMYRLVLAIEDEWYPTLTWPEGRTEAHR